MNPQTLNEEELLGLLDCTESRRLDILRFEWKIRFKEESLADLAERLWKPECEKK